MQPVINRPCCPPLAKITGLQLHILNITSSVSGTWSRALASLWGTPAVKSCPWRSVELAVWWKMVPRSAMTRSSPRWWTCPRRCATWTPSKLADLSPSSCLVSVPSTSARSCRRRRAFSSSRSRDKFQNLSWPSGALTQPQLSQDNPMMRMMPLGLLLDRMLP